MLLVDLTVWQQEIAEIWEVASIYLMYKNVVVEYLVSHLAGRYLQADIQIDTNYEDSRAKAALWIMSHPCQIVCVSSLVCGS